MNIQFSKATNEDLPQIANVHYIAWIETYTGMIDEAFLATRSKERSLASFKATGHQNIIVARCEDKIIGFCGYGKARDEFMNSYGEIYGLYVLKDYHRLSIGKTLLSKAKDALKELGYQDIYLWVLGKNKNAIDFYIRNHFIYSQHYKNEPFYEELYILK